MTTHDNAAPPDDWRPVPHLARCCGTFAYGLTCEVCGHWIDRT